MATIFLATEGKLVLRVAMPCLSGCAGSVTLWLAFLTSSEVDMLWLASSDLPLCYV